MTALLAVWGHGSWGGASKIHAADRNAPATDSLYPSNRYYTSLCGQKLQRTNTNMPSFTDYMEMERCQRCEKLAKKFTPSAPTTEVFLRVAIRIVQDETTDVPSLLQAIDGQSCTIDIAGFRFDGEATVIGDDHLYTTGHNAPS